MQQHRIVSRDEWTKERKAFLAKEKEFTRARDRLSAERRALPWVKVDKAYVFDTPEGKKTKQCEVVLYADAAEKAARFAAAEAVRWTEWGVRSYHTYLLGLSLILFAVAMGSAIRIPRLVSYLVGLCGLAYLVQGWIVGVEGFSPSSGLPTLAGYILWMIQRSFYGPVLEKFNQVKDADNLEKVYMFIFVAIILAVGIYPAILTKMIDGGLTPLVQLLGR